MSQPTINDVARRAGVSHSAPLRHFRNFADLLAAVAARGFALLSQSVEKSSAQVALGAGPIARLEAAGHAYVRVAVARPGLFALMFRPDELDLGNTEFQRESRAAFEHLVRHVRAAQDAGWRPTLETRLLAGSIWSAVHGLATLWSQGAFLGAVPDASLHDAVSTTLNLVLATKENAHHE